MPIQIIRNDITKMQVDAIVNAANSSLLGGGGVDGAIHRAAGPALLEECRAIRAREGGCRTGDAKLTGAGRLPCKYVIHTVGPVWQGGGRGEADLLASCYRRSLALAAEKGCRTVAFPLISAGAYGYPKEQALRIAADTIREVLQNGGPDEMTVYLVVFDKAAYQISSERYAAVAAYIDDHYAEERAESAIERQRRAGMADMAAVFDAGPPLSAPAALKMTGTLSSAEKTPVKKLFGLRGKTAAKKKAAEDAAPPHPAAPAPDALSLSAPPVPMAAALPAAPAPRSLDEALGCLDESFSEMLLRKIDERGITDAACYKKANISRKLFSKIRADRLYRPSKPTALAFALALELPLDETKELLMKAGFALSHSSKFDVIVEYFIRNGNYDVLEINETLFAFDQCLLGSV